jgi:protein-L-isoaspartate(D-aspartate) O-methyltransferase
MLLLEEEKKALISELRAKGIKDEKLLSAFFKVPRERFIPEPFRKYAYEDNALPIECKQTISQPFTIAYMTMELEVNKGDRILEVGTGSGYQAAILCELGAEVYSIERIEKLYQTAGELLNKLNYKVQLKLGDGTLGWEENAPYDGIIVTAGAPSIPKSLVQQLKIDGRLVVPVGSLDTQKLYVLKRTGEGINYKVHESFKFVPLLGEEGWDKSLQ